VSAGGLNSRGRITEKAVGYTGGDEVKVIDLVVVVACCFHPQAPVTFTEVVGGAHIDPLEWAPGMLLERRPINRT